MDMRITPRKVPFRRSELSGDALRRSYERLAPADEPPLLVYAMLDAFLRRNSGGDNLLLRISDDALENFFTITRNPNLIRIQYYIVSEGFNVELYAFELEYPDLSREKCQDGFYENSSRPPLVYGFLYALERYYDRWIVS
jgi:hypothetical protein